MTNGIQLQLQLKFTEITRSSAIAEKPRDASLYWNVHVLRVYFMYTLRELGQDHITNIYTVSQKCHQTHDGNFIKSQPIFQNSFITEREGNFQ